jgi:hypothetical protein
MTIDDLRNRELIILECISGSRAYGLATKTSDTDIKGVFILPKSNYYGFDYIPQVSNETNDIVFYELGRFMELLALNNPNILELLNTPKESILYKHPCFEKLDPKTILSKRCSLSFGKFAYSQIKKAKGLNKKIMNPFSKEKKSILSFCFISAQYGSMPLNRFLEVKGWNQKNCGLVNIPHMKDLYGLYYEEHSNYQGIVSNDSAQELSLSSIPKGCNQEALLYFNKDGYSTYCSEYKEYWSWVSKRNQERYSNTISHGKNYDAKNMMHVFRLLDMAIEIGRDREINVKRPNRDFLLKIKAGEFEYDDLLELANSKQQEMEVAFEESSLPEQPNKEFIKQLTYELRNELYKDTTFH